MSKTITISLNNPKATALTEDEFIFFHNYPFKFSAKNWIVRII